MWKDVSETPTENKYYLTWYYNTQPWKKKVGSEYELTSEPRYLFKAFVWNGDKWCFRFDPDVIAYWNVPHDYYVPCQMQEGVESLPEKYWYVRGPDLHEKEVER